MKKSLVALAVLGAFSGLAFADGNVTVSGSIDAGVMSVSKSGTNGNGGSVLGFQDAQLAPSTYGLHGTEDLGGGLKAGFDLVGGFNAGSGTHNSPGVYQSQMFGEEANVSLSGSWGKFTAGLQVDPAFIAAIATEPRGMTDSLSSIEYWIVATAFNGAAGPGLGGTAVTGTSLQGGLFDQNAISYSIAANGFSLGLLYGFGGVAGSTAANSQTSIGASYSNSGFTVSAGYVVDKANVAATATTPAYTGTNSQIDFIGVAYAFAPFDVKVQYGEFKSQYNTAGTNADDIKNWGIGLDWKSGANNVNLSYYDAKDNGAGLGGSTKEIGLLDTYSLSKRTTVYGQIASVKVNNNAGESSFIELVYTPDPAAAVNASTAFIGIGMRHTF